jgi:peptide/nickel transport system permease protein
VEVAISRGAAGGFIVFRHILPHLLPVMSIVATLQVAQMILQETALAFLGLGLPPPAATRGSILAEEREGLFVAPWIANLAGVSIILLVWGVNILGSGLRERFDPRGQGATNPAGHGAPRDAPRRRRAAAAPRRGTARSPAGSA